MEVVKRRICGLACWDLAASLPRYQLCVSLLLALQLPPFRWQDFALNSGSNRQQTQIEGWSIKSAAGKPNIDLIRTRPLVQLQKENAK